GAAGGGGFVGECLGPGLSLAPDPPVANRDLVVADRDLPELPGTALHQLEPAPGRPRPRDDSPPNVLRDHRPLPGPGPVHGRPLRGGDAQFGPDADVGGEAGPSALGQFLVAEGDEAAYGWRVLALGVG